MKSTLCGAVAVLALAACNKGPTVELKNASGNEVAKAVTQSGVLNGGSMIEPGLWQTKTTFTEMNMPGLPPQYAEQMKRSMAENREKASHHCITEADVKKPKEEDRKSTRLNSSHANISYAVFCLKKKKTRLRKSSSAFRRPSRPVGRG